MVKKQNDGRRWGLSIGPWLALCVVAVSCAATPEGSPLLERSAQSRAARLLARRLPALHLTAPRLDEAFGQRAFDALIDQLDRNRYYFLASDIEAFQRDAAEIHQSLRAGDLSFAFRVFERFRERVADRYAFAEAELADGPPTVAADDFLWRRKEAPWPEDREAWDELWRLRLNNEWLARVVAVRLAEEEKSEENESEPNSADALEDEELSDRHLDPEAFVLNRHRQFKLVLEDSDDLWILEKYFNAFTQALDPHSEYLSPSRTEDFDINMRLSLFGIGALLSTEDGAARIVRILPGGPAERDGRLQPGDRIIAVAQGDAEPVHVLHWPLYRMVRLIRGEKGTRVVLTVWPASDLSGATERRIDLVRDEVRLEERAARSSVHTLRCTADVERTLGVVTLPDFYADFRGDSDQGEARRSSRDVRRLMGELQDRGVEGMVLDLRNNGGGSLMDAVEIAGLFIESGPVVQVRDRRGIHVLNDPSDERLYAGPLVVLVNRMSASASEIVAAALQDYHRALVVGDSRTHGKGTVQSLLPLERRAPELGSLKVTTAEFYRISGASTQVRGVTPDLIVPSPMDAMEVGEEYLPNALPWASIPAAFYATMDGDVPSPDRLRLHSNRRRDEDPRHQERESLIEEIARMRSEDRISLDLETRLAWARQERAVNRWQERVPETTDPDEDGAAPEPDLVLEEALCILADVVGWRDRAAPDSDSDRRATRRADARAVMP